MLVTLSGAEPASRPEFPFSHVTQERVLLAETLTQQADLRQLYCPLNVLRDRIQRKVAVLEMRGFVPKAVEDVPSKEVHLDRRVRMRAFLDMAGLKAWHRGQPQIKLIRQNAILQSPLFGTDTKLDRKNLLQSWVEPGDLVVVAKIL